MSCHVISIEVYGLCIASSVSPTLSALVKKNSWHFRWTHRCSIIQWPQKANSDPNTHNNSILLELTLFYCLAKFGVGVGRCSYSYRLCPRMERCVWQTATRHIREREKKTKQQQQHRYEIYSEWQKKNWTLRLEQTFVSCLWSNCWNLNSFDIDWGLVLSNETLNNLSVQEKTENSSPVSSVKTCSVIYFLDSFARVWANGTKKYDSLNSYFYIAPGRVMRTSIFGLLLVWEHVFLHGQDRRLIFPTFN